MKAKLLTIGMHGIQNFVAFCTDVKSRLKEIGCKSQEGRLTSAAHMDI